ncbi:5344_t:CDS:1 [Acaulospora colombiana]|uniref:5344_t:CDS:1 n=1 Tax=Acaulospora colombiana TaxID=27376 RepID=A0ACA9N4M3_9GLOM|nr:5344_t:CDS:1 [Acaulospora colombiana]
MPPLSTPSFVESDDDSLLKNLDSVPLDGKSLIPGNTIFTKEEVPKLTDIKKRIPKEYFIPSIYKSFQYVIQDLLIVVLLFTIYMALDSTSFVPPFLKTFLLLPLYTLSQGTMFWAIFVLGHDCGHGSFSRNTSINNIFGTFLHTLILVPYTAWKLSHRHHHKNTGNIDKDEVFFPLRKSEAIIMTGGSGETKLIPYFGFGLGWIIYLVSGYGTRATSHINPFSPLFSKDRVGAITSLACVLAALTCLFYASSVYGIWSVVRYYFLPWFVFASWLVVTTFLHHHGVEENIKLPWFADEEWSYVVGNLSSVDRDYGILRDVTHNIGTHQVHHLFPIIPHYHLKEATAAFQQNFPHLKRESKEPIIKTFIETFKVWKSQFLIGNDTKIFVYKNEKTKQT